MKQKLLSLFCLLPALWLHAQPSTPAAKHWRISARQAALLHEQGEAALTEAYYREPADSVPPGTPRSLGHYLMVQADLESRRLWLHSQHEHHAGLLPSGRRLLLRLSDAKGQAVDEAEVRMGEKQVPYHAPLQAYRLPKRPKTEELLHIALPGDTLFYRLSELPPPRRPSARKPWARQANRKDGWAKLWAYPYYFLRYHLVEKPKAKRRLKQQQRRTTNGYLALSQPRYRPGDTLRWSAYLTDGRGKPITDTLMAYIEEARTGKKRFWTQLLPPQPGLAARNWPLPKDSLRQGLSHTLVLQPKHGSYSALRQAFRYEDYQLREASYTFSAAADAFATGDTLAFLAEGKDANGLYLTDARLKLVLLNNQLTGCSVDSFRLPDTLWAQTVPLRPDAPTRVAVPDSLLPPCTGEWAAHAFFTNSNGELHHRHLTVRYRHQRLGLHLQIEGDTLLGYARRNGRTVPLAATLTAQCVTGPQQQAVTLPFRLPLNPAAQAYTLSAEGETEQLSVGSRGSASLVQLSGEFWGDTLAIFIRNPRRLAIAWHVEGERGVLGEGMAQGEDYLHLLPKLGRRDCRIKINYIWGGRLQGDEATVARYKNQLRIALRQPDKVLPGEVAQVEVAVTDYKQRPVPNTRLAAGAVNAQFPEGAALRAPRITHRPAKFKQAKRYELDKAKASFRLDLDADWYQRLHLDSLLFYQLRFPERGLHFHYDTLDLGRARPEPPQFAPFAVRKGKAQPIYLIYCNRELLYYYGLSGSPPYSFAGRAGYNRITIRTIDREYTLDSVLLKPGCKLDFSLDLDRYPQSRWPIKTNIMPKELTAAEKRLLHQSIFLLNNPTPRGYTYVMDTAGVQVHQATSSPKPFLLGPFKAGATLKRHFQGGSTAEFSFEPGFSYDVLDRRERLYQHQLFAESKSIPLPSLPLKPEGQRLLTRADIKPMPKRAYSSTAQGRNLRVPGMGRYQFRYQAPHDSLALRYVAILQNDSLLYAYNGRSRVFSQLAPGDYELRFFLGEGWVHQRPLRVVANSLYVEDLQDMALVHDDSLWTEHGLFGSLPARTPIGNPYQNRGRLISGRVVGEYGDEPLIFASVALYVDGQLTAGTEADFEGYYELWVPEGPYSLEFQYVGYTKQRLEGIGADGPGEVRLAASSASLQEVLVVDYRVPIVQQDNTTQGMTISASEIQNLPTRDVNALASVAAGAAGMEDGLSIKGSRSEATHYYIDGIRAGAEAHYGLGEGRVRSDFRDQAWWQPQLRTGPDGRAAFQVQYPDDITAWRSFAVGQDGRSRAGVGYGLVQAYQPLYAQLATPRFLLHGDQSSVVGKLANRTGDSLSVATRLLVADSLSHRSALRIAEGASESIPLHAPAEGDSLRLTYRLELGRFVDGEQRSLPLFPVGVLETAGHFAVLEVDTTVRLATRGDYGPVRLYAEGNILGVLLEEAGQLARYPYGCNEQTASRLLGLLLEKDIRAKLGQPFEREADIKQAVARLQERQHPDGHWGWWPGGRHISWINLHVLRALQQAEAAGYPSQALERGLRLVTSQLNQLEGRELLEHLRLLSDAGQALDYERYLPALDSLELPLLHRLQLIRLRQSNGLPYRLDSLHHYAQRSLLGGLFWGEERHHLRYNINQPTLEAYRILRHEGNEQALRRIRQYLLRTRDGRYGLGWRNTYETASVLSALLPDVLNAGPAPTGPASLAINGRAIEVESGRSHTAHYPAGKPIVLSKTGGGPLFLSVTQQHRNPQPVPKSDVFRISTHLEQGGQRVEQLRPGERAALIATVSVSAEAEYVLLELPIPAGCSYAEGQGRQPYEVHRELWRQHAAVFCERLPAGEHRFRVELEPRFPGRYTLNPSRAEQMYFPVFYGHGEVKEVVVD